MTPRKLRFVSTATALALLFAGGVYWLVRTVVDSTPTTVNNVNPVASGRGQPEASLSPYPGPPSSPDASPTSVQRTGRPPPPTATKTRSYQPPAPVHSIRISGPLGGSPMDDSCSMIKNKFDVTVTLESIRLVQPENRLVIEYGHCPAQSFKPFVDGLKPCIVDDKLAPGATCYTGVELAKPDGRGGETVIYSAGLLFTFEATCTNDKGAPCSDDQVTRHAPSPANPVRIRWESPCSCTVSVAAEASSPAETGSPTASETPSSTTPSP